MFRIHSIIPFLKFWLMPIFGLSFAAGASALGGAAGETAGAVIDAAASGEGEGGEEGAGDGEGGEGAGAGEGEGAAAAQGAEGAQGGDKGAADGRKMPAALRSHIAELKAAGKNDVAKEINTVFWGFKKLQSDIATSFPGGIKEAVELKQQLEDLGGVEAFNELQAEAEEWRSVDEQLENGDPSVVKTLFEQFPDGLKQVMPAALENWSAADPEGYDKHFAGVMLSTLRESEIPNNLKLAYSLLSQYDAEKNPAIKEALGLIAGTYNWIGNLNKVAAKPAAAAGAAPNKNERKLSEREQRVAANERKQILATISTNFQQFTTPKLETELKNLFGGKALPANVNKQEVFKRAMVNVFSVLGAGGNAAKGIKSAFEKKYDAYLDAGDQDGAAKYLKSKAEPLLAEALKKSYKWLYGEAALGAGKGNAAGAGKGNQNANAGKGGDKNAGGNTDGGFELIGYDPKPESIDRAKTTRQMIFKNQAILKSGKKVTWKRDAPSEK